MSRPGVCPLRASAICATVLASLAGPAPAAAAGEPALAEAVPVRALPLTTALHLDGRLDEADWQSGTWCTDFHVLNRPGQTAAYQTRFKVRADSRRLYVGIEADEPHPDLMRLETLERDGPVSRDDCLEVMVDATGGRAEYFHFIVNAAGALYDAQLRQGGHVRSREWNSTASAAARVGSDRWSVELAIPLVELGIAPASTGDWALNVARERRVQGNELSTYAPMTGGFHQAALYARLHMVRQDLSAYLWDLPYPHAQRVVMDARGRPELVVATRVANGTGTDRHVQVRALLDNQPGPWSDLHLADGAVADIEVRVPEIDLGVAMLRLELAAAGDADALLAVRQTEITARYQPLAATVVQPFYRNSIYATEDIDQIIFQLRSDLDAGDLEELALEAALVAVDGGDTVCTVLPGPFRTDGALALPPAGLTTGAYDLVISLRARRDGAARHRVVERLHKLPPAAHEWRLDRDLVLRYNGEPVLPFGWFSIPPAAMADGGHAYTLMQAYSSYWRPVEEVRAFLDEVAAAGTAVTISPYPYPEFVSPASVWGQPLTEKEAADLKERVQALADHPGLFAWYMADEPELRPALPARCRRIYEVVRQADPYHPCIMLNDTEAGIYKYRDGGDVLMPDPYPLFLQDGLAARPLEKVGRFMRAARDAGGGRLATWITPQGFNYGDYGQENNRCPRFLELRNQLYQAAVYGARGFLWYTYSQVPNYPDLDIGMRWLSREVADLKPYLLAPLSSLPLDVQAPRAAHLHTSLRHSGSHLVLLAVSTATEGQEVAIRLPPSVRATSLHVVSENRSVPVEDGVLRDRFELYETHIYTTDPALGGREDVAVPARAIARADSARRKSGNLAFEATGVEVAVSSRSRYGSTPTRLTDGIEGGMRWRDGTPGEYPDWLQLTWPAEQRVGRLVLYGKGYTSAEARVPGPGESWVAVGRAADPSGGRLVIELKRAVSAERLRLYLSGDPAAEEHTMVYEVEAYAD